MSKAFFKCALSRIVHYFFNFLNYYSFEKNSHELRIKELKLTTIEKNKQYFYVKALHLIPFTEKIPYRGKLRRGKVTNFS